MSLSPTASQESSASYSRIIIMGVSDTYTVPVNSYAVLKIFSWQASSVSLSIDGVVAVKADSAGSGVYALNLRIPSGTVVATAANATAALEEWSIG